MDTCPSSDHSLFPCVKRFFYSVDNLTFLVSCSPLSIRVSVREKVYGGSLSVAPNSMAGRP